MFLILIVFEYRPTDIADISASWKSRTERPVLLLQYFATSTVSFVKSLFLYSWSCRFSGMVFILIPTIRILEDTGSVPARTHLLTLRLTGKTDACYPDELLV